MGIYPTKNGLGKTCTPRHIFDFISERREWTIGGKHDAIDICARYKVLTREAIPELAEEDKILEQSMKASVAWEVRSKYNANPVL